MAVRVGESLTTDKKITENLWDTCVGLLREQCVAQILGHPCDSVVLTTSGYVVSRHRTQISDNREGASTVDQFCTDPSEGITDAFPLLATCVTKHKVSDWFMDMLRSLCHPH